MYEINKFKMSVYGLAVVSGLSLASNGPHLGDVDGFSEYLGADESREAGDELQWFH
jgi:hypothetical protein